jgi:hypothetical protein
MRGALPHAPKCIHVVRRWAHGQRCITLIRQETILCYLILRLLLSLQYIAGTLLVQTCVVEYKVI